ncbi:MAG: hypothetical protein UU47_C0012G0013 [candidate division TM6 bacterium GW2011_GWE2_41_16]|nr:MAG: hypothetical protein UU47_C0012G0013 [candidate division TM6 bacterium GW2011_GWE2_41_16]
MGITLLCLCSLASAQKDDELQIPQPLSPHNIVLFIEPLMATNPAPSLENIAIKIPKNLAHTQLKAYLMKQIVLFASYAGVVSYSDYLGQITFPRRHEQNEITCIVTPEIKFHLYPKNTVQKITIQQKTPAQSYKFTRTKDEQRDFWFWTVTKEETPKDIPLPQATLFLFAKPEHIYIPLESTSTVGGPHLVLPTFYATKLMNSDANVLSYIKLARFFRPLKKMIKKSDDRIGMQVF